MAPGARRSRVCAWLAACVVIAAGPGCSDNTAGPDPGGMPIRGRVHAPAGYAVEGLDVVWAGSGGGAGARATTGHDGRFELVVSRPDSVGELKIEGPAGRRFHPFAFPLRAGDAGDLDIVMVPRFWTIRSGVHEGLTVGTSLDPVVEDNADQLFYTYFFGQPEPRDAPTHYRIDPMTWPLDALPARVAFDHRHGSPDLAPHDSAAIWAALDRMEEVFGLDLFTPVEADPLWWPDPPGAGDGGLVPGVIRVVYDPPTWLARPLGEEAPRVWERDLGDYAASGRFDAFRVNQQRLNGGTLFVGALDSLRLADGLVPWPTVLMHETLHVLGVGHTCRFPSTQGPCGRQQEPSQWDVAYMELLREIIALERAHDTNLGLVPALIGERKSLGFSALPELRGQ